jgi:hypothetical protein
MSDFPNSESVARRIVMPRRTWEQLEHLAEALRETRDVDVSATDVALIALEAGLAEIRRGSPNKRKRAVGKGGSGRTRRNKRVRLTDPERSELDALVAETHTTRGRQRAIAMWIGARRKKIETETLRQLTLAHDCYDVANFAQNMKKDGAYFREIRGSGGERQGWRLTKIGAEQAQALLESVAQPTLASA